MDAPTVRTRLISSASGPQHNDYFFIYVSTIVTVTVLLSSAFLVWRWGLQGFGTHLSVALAIALLIFNAYLGAKAWSDLHQENEVFLKHQRFMQVPRFGFYTVYTQRTFTANKIWKKNIKNATIWPSSRPMPQIRPTNKFCRDLASPVWIERNIYYEDNRNGKVPASA